MNAEECGRRGLQSHEREHDCALNARQLPAPGAVMCQTAAGHFSILSLFKGECDFVKEWHQIKKAAIVSHLTVPPWDSKKVQR